MSLGAVGAVVIVVDCSILVPPIHYGRRNRRRCRHFVILSVPIVSTVVAAVVVVVDVASIRVAIVVVVAVAVRVSPAGRSLVLPLLLLFLFRVDCRPPSLFFLVVEAAHTGSGTRGRSRSGTPRRAKEPAFVAVNVAASANRCWARMQGQRQQQAVRQRGRSHSLLPHDEHNQLNRHNTTQHNTRN